MRQLIRPLRTLGFALALAAVVACGGGDGGGGPTDDGGTDDDGSGPIAPSNLTYLLADALYRVGEAIVANPASVDGDVDTYTVDPALPDGLTLDPATGEITGTPSSEWPISQHTVTATNAGGSTSTQIAVSVGKQLPAVVQSLALGFLCDVVAEGMTNISKIALGGDGRVFFTELAGRLGVVAANGTVSTLTTETVTTGGHHGLIGLALSPTFGTDGWIYLQVTTDLNGTAPAPLQEVVRWTDGTPPTTRTVLITNLPAAAASAINNGGELHFDGTGNLLVSIGDVGTASNAQQPTTMSLAGKILRYTPAGGIPNDNPLGMDPEFCRGMRNVYAIAVHPDGHVFALDNEGDDMAGSMQDDEINFVLPGENFAWGWTAGGSPPNEGFTVQSYASAIVPTGGAWHNGAGFGPAYDDDLFATWYLDHNVRRYEFAFQPGLALDNESIWATFVDDAGKNHPIDIEVDAATGDMYIATFSGIYRFYKQ